MRQNSPNSKSTLCLYTSTSKRWIAGISCLIFFLVSNSIQAQIALRGAATTGTSTNTNLAIARPAGVVAGDIMLVNIAKGGNRTTNPSSSGWILIDGRSLAGGTERHGAVLYKIATATEPANYTFALGGGTNSASGGIIAFSGVDNTTPFDVPSTIISVQPSQTTVVATSITTVTANTAIIMFGQAAGDNPTWNSTSWNTTNPGLLTELFDIGQGSNDQSSVGAAWQLKPAAGPTGNGTATLSFAERNGGILVALRPACTISATPTTISGATTICNGNSTTLTVSGGTVGLGATIQWFSGSCGGTSVGTGNSITVSPSSTTTYFVRYSGSCNTTTCISSTVTVNTNSTAPTSILGSTAICEGNSTTLTLNGGIAGTSAVAQWFSGSCGGTSLGSGNSITVSPTNNTNYFVRYSGTCNTTICATANVTVNTLAIAPTTIIGTTTICEGNTTTLTVTGGSTGTTGTAQWFTDSCGGTLLGTGNSITVAPISTTTYFVRYSGLCNTTTCTSTTVTVNSQSTAPTGITGTNTICDGSPTTLTLIGGTIGTGATAQWFSGSCGGTLLGSGSSITVAPTSTTNYFVRYSGTCNTTNCATLSVVVNTPQTIALQPLISQTVCSDSSVNFSVNASGTVSSYQWYNGTTLLVDGGAISGSSSSTLTINPVSLADASTNYFCVINGPCAAPISSNLSELIVHQKVSIQSQPQVSQTFCIGDTATLSVVAAGTGLTYQWYKGAVPLVDGGTISGATSSSLTITALVVGDSSNNYYCIVSGTNPCTSVTSSNATIVVNTYASIVIQPVVTQTICANQFADFFVTATGTNLSYQWYRGSTMLIDGGTISGATTSMLTINPIALSDAASDYYCIVSNSCTPSLASNNSELIINQTPLIPDQTRTICSEELFTLNLVNGVPTPSTVVPSNTTYTWPAPILTGGMTGGSSGNNETAISQTLNNPTNTPQTATYFVTPTSGNTGSCIGPAFVLRVTVRPKPEINNIVADFCSAENFSFTPTNGGGNVVPSNTTYSWGIPIVTGGMTGGSVGNNELSINQTLVNPTSTDQTASYTITATSDTCPSSTFSVEITIHPKPTVAGSVLTQSICSGSAIAPILLSNPNGIPGTIDYSWSRDNTINTTGMPSSGNTNVISGSLLNTSNIPQTTVFSLLATSDESCTSDVSTVSVIVNPIPDVSASPSSQTVCSESAITPISITSPNAVVGTSYTWTRDNIVNLTGIAAAGNSNSIFGSLTNNTNVPQTTTFTITSDANGCGSTISSVTITVNPKPTIAASPATQTICGNSAIASIVISNPNSVAGTTYSWTRNNILNITGIGNSGSGSSISGTLQNNANIDQTVTFTLFANAGSCPSTPITADVIVQATPLVTTVPTSQTRCHLQAITTINISNSNAVSGTTYSWTRVNTTNLTGIPASGTGNSITGSFSNNTSSTQTTTFSITATAPNGCSTSSTATVTVYAPLVAPTINAPQTVCVFANPSLLTIATPASGGSGLYTYQWQSSTDNITYNNIGGATANSYQPPFVNMTTQNTYYRLVTNNICGSVTSNVIFVEVVSNVGFSFGFDDGLTGAICSGSTFTPNINSVHFSTSAVRFTWTANTSFITPAAGGPVGTTGGAFLGFRTSSANIGPLTAVNNTNATVVTSMTITPNVYNFPGPPSGSFICSTSPQTFNVTIRPIPVASATGNNTTICNGTGPGVVVSGNITDAATSFAWTRNNTVNVTGANSGNSGSITAGGTFSLNPTLTNTTLVSQVVQFTITPTSNGCIGSPIIISITVAPTVTSGAVSANQTLCNIGDPAAFTETSAAAGLNLTYQWQSSINNIVYNNISGATGNTYDSGAISQTTWFRRIVTSTVNGTLCTATTTPIIVTLNNISAGSISGTQTICSGGNPAAFGQVAATGSGIITYQWQSNTVGCGGPWFDIVGETNTTYDVPSGLTTTTYYRRIAISTLGIVQCSDFSSCITVFVNDINAGAIAGEQTLCGNNPSALTEVSAASATGTLSYQWQSNTTGCSGPWNNISGATAATYDPPAGVVVTTYYQRVSTSTLNSIVCSATSNCVTVTANAITPGAISGNRTICNGGDPAAFTETVAATGTNLSFQWQISTVSSAGPWTDILGATSSTFDAVGPITQTTYYRRVATATVNSTNCSANSNFVTVFVNNVIAPVVNGDQTVCGAFGSPAAFTITSAASGSGVLSYQWQRNTVGCSGPWTNISGATSVTYTPANPSVTTYYRLVTTSTLNSVQCSAISNCFTITNLSKTWTGLVNTDWNEDGNWFPIGVPTSADCVIIPNTVNDPIIMGTNYNGNAKSVDVLAGGALEINATNALTVIDVVNVNATGSFFIRNNASLVQVNNLPNVGNVRVERITTPMYRFDYTYWGSPVTLASAFTLGMLSPNTLSDKFFSWTPTVANSFGNWFFESAATVMDPTKGYIVRAPQSFSTNPAVKVPYTANFVGTPNNGDILCPIYFGGLPLTNNNDKYNLLGNPYPSAVDAELFLSDPANTPVIDGTIYFWTHNSPPSSSNVDPFYGDFIFNYAQNDYASWNRLGGTGTTAAAGSGGQIPNGYIASGQGFFTKSTAGVTSGDPVVFKNSMRVNFNNDQFFRSSIVDAQGDRFNSATNEKHRIWLNLVNQGGSFNQILVGYATDATNGFDRDYDGVKFTDNNAITFYSINSGRNLVIQGRSLPFDNQDIVRLGFKSTVNDTFSIRIDHFDGLFENQNIYVEDRLLNIIHNLKLSPYTFISGIGTFDDRFVLRYTTTGLLSQSDFVASAALFALLDDEKLQVSASELMLQIELFDITGKKVKRFELEKLTRHFESQISIAEGIYVLTVKLNNGIIISRKLVTNK